jgi:hypothetical protein
MIQTLAKSEKIDYKDNMVLMVDECFVAGTLVDGIPIEKLCVGDYVTAFDSSNNLHKAKITHVFVNKAPSKLYKLQCDNIKLVCTGNHRIYTTHGWKTAESLTIGEQIYVNNTVSNMRKDNTESKQLGAETFIRRSSNILQQDMSEYSTSRGDCRENDKEQSNLQTRCERENRSIPKGNKPQTTEARREWSWHDCASRIIVGIIKRCYIIYSRISNLNKAEERFRLSYKLQSRFRKHGFEASNRDRWRISLQRQKIGDTTEEGIVSNTVRLDSIEILESTDIDRFERVCTNGIVYNIEVEDYNTYFANGIAVHNCHHISSNQMMDVLFSIPGSYRYGFSGTPLKYDVLSDMKLVAATGDILYETTNKFLIEAGYSAVPKVRMHVVESDDLVDWEMNYQDAYNTLIVNNHTRNTVIAKQASESSGIVLILVNRIDHGKILHEMIPNSVFVSGSDSTEDRNFVIERMRDGESGTYIATPIFDEGIDVPAVDTIILAAGGKSHVKLLQRVGRGLRKKDGDNTLIVHDFLDDTNSYLLEHSQERADTYARQKFETCIAK